MRGQRTDIINTSEAILARIKSKCVETESGCWEWVNKVGQHGRPVMSIKGKQTLAYRHAYEAAYGSFDSSLCILHKCDNPKCCNPEHLATGTNRDNQLDYLEKYGGYKEVQKSLSRPANLHGKELQTWLLDNCTQQNEDGCMVWQRETGKDGYGRIKYQNKKYASHRLIWALANEDFESLEDRSLVIRHCCPKPNRGCCNPAHLKIGTKRDNALDVQLSDRVESIDTIIEWLRLYEFCLNETGPTIQPSYTKFAKGLRDLGLVKDTTKDSYVVNALRGKSHKHLHEEFFDWTPLYT
jgi:hypothetical protein